MFKIQALDHVAVSVSDIERSARWYCEVFGFKREHGDVWHGVPVFVTNGEAAMALFPVSAHGGATSGEPPAIRTLHFAFRADRKNFLQAQEELQKRGIDFSFQDHEVSHSIYFCDPDRHKVEITTYEL